MTRSLGESKALRAPQVDPADELATPDASGLAGLPIDYVPISRAQPAPRRSRWRKRLALFVAAVCVLTLAGARLGRSNFGGDAGTGASPRPAPRGSESGASQPASAAPRAAESRTSEPGVPANRPTESSEPPRGLAPSPPISVTPRDILATPAERAVLVVSIAVRYSQATPNAAAAAK